jgi:hypothetical protein
LPSASRALLAEKIVESLEFDIDPKIQVSWVAEVKKRINEVKNADIQHYSGGWRRFGKFIGQGIGS